MSKYKIPNDLYQYQKDDLERLLKSDESFLNLSEMGTGKTPVAIGLAMMKGYESTLIVCPKTLRLEWERQIEDWTGIKPLVSKRSSTRRLDPLFEDMTKETHNPFFVGNYETFRTKRHRELLNSYPFELVILDEAHKLRNSSTSMTRGMLEFLSNHPGIRVLAMTGSPIVNTPGDIHTLLCMVRPTEFNLRNRSSFEYRYSTLKVVSLLKCFNCGNITTRLWDSVCPKCGSTRMGIITSKKFEGGRNMVELKERTSPYTIRHSKKEVLPWLPSVYNRKVILSMPTDQYQTYKQMERELFIMLDNGEPLWAPGVLSKLTRLRQLNLDPRILGVNAQGAKTSFLKELIESTDEPIVIFSCFEEYIELLDKELQYPKVLITGKIDPDDRMKNTKKFQEDNSVKLALGTIQCMGEGITLTRASTVVLVDRWWTPAAQDQAIGRLHRIGQDEPVEVIIPVTENSIDSSLDKVLERKKAYSDGYLGERESIKDVLDDLRETRKEEGVGEEGEEEEEEEEEEREGREKIGSRG